MLNRKDNIMHIIKYINGEMDLDVAENLENNTEFMISVIKYTKDKNMYHFCSDNVKQDYNMVKFMITTFDDNIDLINELANNYIINNDDSDDYTLDELNIIMSNIYRKKYNDEPEKYTISAKAFLSFNMCMIENLLNTDKSIKEKMGLGFLCIADSYSNSEIIKNFFAEEFINKIFYEDKENLETILHNNYESYDMIIKNGINNFIINYISTYDKYLSAYISNHLFLINDVKKSLDRIKKNWNAYNNRKNIEKIEFFVEKIENYRNDSCSFVFTIDGMIDYVSKKLKLEKIFESYKNLPKFDYFDDFYCKGRIDDCISDYETELLIDRDLKKYGMVNPKDMNFQDLICLNNIIKIAKEIFIDNKAEQNECIISEVCSNVNNKAKILKFPNKNNNIVILNKK